MALTDLHGILLLSDFWLLQASASDKHPNEPIIQSLQRKTKGQQLKGKIVSGLYLRIKGFYYCFSSKRDEKRETKKENKRKNQTILHVGCYTFVFLRCLPPSLRYSLRYSLSYKALLNGGEQARGFVIFVWQKQARTLASHR